MIEVCVAAVAAAGRWRTAADRHQVVVRLGNGQLLE